MLMKSSFSFSTVRSLFLLPVAIIAVWLSTASFSPRPDESYNKNGISFTMPDDWKITDEERDDQTFSMSCEKKGENASGIVTIVWIDVEMTAEALMDIFVAQTEKTLTDNNYSGIKLSDPAKAKLGAYDAVKVRYMFSTANLPHTGYLYTFMACGKPMCVSIQEADEDHAVNKAGFEKITSSFGCIKAE